MTGSSGTRRQILVAAAGAAVAVTAAFVSCTGTDPGPSPGQRPTPGERRPTTPAGEPRDVPVASCGGAPSARLAQVQGDAAPPWCEANSWRFDLPATDDPTDRRRSEIWLDRQAGPYRVGDLAEVELRIWAALGDAAFSNDDWHLLWQLHGPTRGAWKGPAVALYVRQGGWFVSGGTGHAGHGVAGRSYLWEQRLGDYRDKAWHHLGLAVRLSDTPSTGSVSAWLGGAGSVDGYRPHTPRGLTPGTLPEGQTEVYSRVGLYRGTTGGAPAPAYEQQVRTVVTRSV